MTNQRDIEDEFLLLYKNLMEKASASTTHIDIKAMRRGKQLDMDQSTWLTRQVTQAEIEHALKGIGDDKSPRVDGYGAKFFKACWGTIKEDVYVVVQEFFRKGRIFRDFTRIGVTLILKTREAKHAMVYRPIAGCSTFYNIISKIMTQ